MIQIAPSILASDFSMLGQAVSSIEKAGCDMVHIDVMDGHFVPNITFGPGVVKSIRPCVHTFFDVHLMISDPMKYIPAFIEAGADGITVHAETLEGHLKEAVDQIHDLGAKAAMAVKPGTGIEVLDEVLDDLDMVLIMTVEPGFGGQSLIEATLEKVRTLRQRYPQLLIQVDGGVNLKTLDKVVEAGANDLVMGTAFFKAEDPKKLADQIHAIE